MKKKTENEDSNNYFSIPSKIKKIPSCFRDVNRAYSAVAFCSD